MTNLEKGVFVKLYNRDGFVLDFTTAEFDTFCMESVGVALCERYKMSKGRSLNAFINSADSSLSDKLLFDLLEYYELTYRDFETETTLNEGGNYPEYYGVNYGNLYHKCKDIFNKYSGSGQFASSAVQIIKEAFSSEYINKQIHLMMSMINENPTEAIGKSKELIESCCKAILEENAQPYDKNWDVPKLVGTTMDYLKITPTYINEDVKEAKSIKSILGSLRAIATGISELRNAYGSGHGKSPNYKGLEGRHARLAVGSALTLVNFLWDSHLRVKSQQAN